MVPGQCRVAMVLILTVRLVGLHLVRHLDLHRACGSPSSDVLSSAPDVAQHFGRLGHHQLPHPIGVIARFDRCAQPQVDAVLGWQPSDDFLQMHAHDRIDATAEARMRGHGEDGAADDVDVGPPETGIGICGRPPGCQLPAAACNSILAVRRVDCREDLTRDWSEPLGLDRRGASN